MSAMTHPYRSIVSIATIAFVALIAVAPGAGAQGLAAERAAQRRARTQTRQSSSEVADLNLPDNVFAEENARIEVIRRAEPAVVSVIVSKDLPVLERSFDELPLGDLRIRVPSVNQRGTEKKVVGGGSAFAVSADGLLITNNHVVIDEDAQYTVLLNTGEKIPARVVERDQQKDLALLKVEASRSPMLTFAPSDMIKLGQTVIAIGNSLGEFRNTVSIGIVSGLQRSITASLPGHSNVETLSEIIQTDAAISEGNSGGPLLNGRGQVIGMNTAYVAGGQNIGFAIPVSALRRFVDQYKRQNAFNDAGHSVASWQLKTRSQSMRDATIGVIAARATARKATYKTNNANAAASTIR